MTAHIVSGLIGALACLVLLYIAGRVRHRGHGHSRSGPSSRSRVRETIIAVKGR